MDETESEKNRRLKVECLTAEIDELKAENGDLHVKYEAMSEVNAGQQAEIDSLRKMLKRGINDSGHYSSTWNFDARELLDR